MAARKPSQETPATEEDDTQRRFREALERKQAKNRAAQGEDHLGGRSMGLHTNDKSVRQFRRKAGG